MDQRSFDLELKAFSEAGTFEGRAAVFLNTDLVGDVIMPNSFRKTIADHGGRVPLLLDHKTPIGIAHISEGPTGLDVNGRLNLDKAIARDVLSDLKFYKANGSPFGMSIGYQVVKSDRQGDVRVLRELRLFECSVTISPANPEARVEQVKRRNATAINVDDFKCGFAAVMKEVRIEREFEDLVRRARR